MKLIIKINVKSVKGHKTQIKIQKLNFAQIKAILKLDLLETKDTLQNVNKTFVVGSSYG